jgi:D-alanyl-D-alanine carboxypeptidase
MDEDFVPKDFRAIGALVMEVAAQRGSTTVELEHVLLAMSSFPNSPAGKFLVENGLDHDSIENALREERTRSLAVAGIGPIDATSLQASPRGGRPQWGASVRNAMEHARRNHSPARRRRNFDTDVLAVILGVDLGTVPRALAIAGVDRADLRSRLENI